MNYKKIEMPREVHIGSGVINRTGDICTDLRFEGSVLVVTGPNTIKIGGQNAIDSLEDSGFSVDSIEVSEASKKSVEEVVNLINTTCITTSNTNELSRNTSSINGNNENTPVSNQNSPNEDKISLVLGVGGGTVIDVAKVASKSCDVPFLSVPTSASHDGIASPLASIKNSKGSISVNAHSPIGVVADTDIIRNAPIRLLASGCADIISNYTAIMDWKLASRLLNESFSDSAAALSQMTAKLILDSSDQIKEGLEESARLVVKSLFSSSMAISIAGSSRPASGAEHKFSHALDKIASKPALHGEQCGVGTIMMMHLHGGDWKCIKNALKSMNAPTNAYELNINEEDIIDALIMAKDVRKDRYTILGDRGLTRSAARKLATKTEVI
ncbi:MAG: NAD(P)-dependent glycerol-1-phosphate dehydrogenase [Methanobacteriaceae archaeon]